MDLRLDTQEFNEAVHVLNDITEADYLLLYWLSHVHSGLMVGGGRLLTLSQSAQQH